MRTINIPLRRFGNVQRKNARIICNADAHQIEQVLAGVQNGIEYAEDLGIPIIDAAEALGFAHK